MPKHTEIVCICGSSRFTQEIRDENSSLTLAGAIVLAPCEAGPNLTREQRQTLNDVHAQKIAHADRVLVVNPGGYIGESTANEIAHAQALGKPVQFTYTKAVDMPERSA